MCNFFLIDYTKTVVQQYCNNYNNLATLRCFIDDYLPMENILPIKAEDYVCRPPVIRYHS